MLSLIFICLFLCFIGYILNKEITWFEFIGNCIISILCSLIVFGLCIIPFDNDYYFKSGKLIQIQYHPSFIEEYEQRHEVQYPCGTDKDGYTKYCTKVYYTTEHAKHREYWSFKDSLNQEKEISQKFYDLIKLDFGNNLHSYNSGKTYRCTYGGFRVSGDNSLYYYNNDTNTYNYPTNKIERWFNPIKRSKSIFNTEKSLLAYPIQQNIFSTNRDMPRIFKKKWDILNTKLYEKLGVNIILVVSNDDLKNAWMQGKKNDIVIQVDSIENPTNVKVFGWYKSERLSAELQTCIIDNGFNLNNIEHVILSYYEPFDFEKFNYLRFQLSDWQMLLIFIITLIVLISSYLYFTNNEFKR